MRRLIYVCAAMIAVSGSRAWPQAPSYSNDTSQYRPTAPTLDRNYGLPSFGLPGAELPQQKATATPEAPSSEPDFLSRLGSRSPLEDPASPSANQQDGDTQDPIGQQGGGTGEMAGQQGGDAPAATGQQDGDERAATDQQDGGTGDATTPAGRNQDADAGD